MNTTSVTNEQEMRHELDPIFKPRSVAVIGATDRVGSVGHTVTVNLVNNAFGRKVFLINPSRAMLLDQPTYPRIGAVPERVDLAVIVTPAKTVPGLIKECVAAGVRGAIVISAGFKELGAPGVELERQMMAEARQGKMRIIGPNCLGIMNPYTGLNATFASLMPQPGNIGFISQSGAFCTAILDWSLQEHVGFSAFISIGSMLDVNWGDLISYLDRDPHTQSIVLYMESVGDARSFLSAAREVALDKPIIVIKAGRTEAAAKAAASHTGSLTGSDEVLDAAFRRSGVLRVDRISHLFAMAEVLAKQPRPRGPHLTIITNAGGPGVLVTDALISDGGELTDLAPQTIEALNQFLPRHWSHANPIDIIGDADPERYDKTLEVVVNDPNTDGLLVVLSPQGMTDPTQTAERLTKYRKARGKPILASWIGGAAVQAGQAILNSADIPTFEYPDLAARIFNYMWHYTKNLQSLYEMPTLPQEIDADRQQAAKVIEAARSRGRTVLTELESKQVLAAYGIPTVETHFAQSEAEAVAAADTIGYPVVLKLHSETITHKTDVGGVKLHLEDANAVRAAFQEIKASVTAKASAADFLGVTVQPMLKLEGYELILGSSIDRQFGPVLLFGLGGQLVEVFKDRALGLPPLTTTLARRMMERTRIYEALKGVRGRASVDLAALEQLMVRFSQLVVEQRWIQEIDINPLLASPEQLIALDARVLLFSPETNEADLPKLAIRPYPSQYESEWQLRDGTPITIQPIRPEDEALMIDFHKTLSEESVYNRYFQVMPLSRRIAHERLSRLAFIDYDREIALVAKRRNPESGQPELLGVGRLVKMVGTGEAEFAVLIGDPWQGQGLGARLLELLIGIGRAEGVERVVGTILPENQGMLRLIRKLGFEVQRSYEDRVVEASYNLSQVE